MQVQIALLADLVSKTEVGLLNILSIFDRINSPAFPATYPQMYYVAKLKMDHSECDQSHEFILEWRDSNESVVGTTALQAYVKDTNDPYVSVDVILKIIMQTFPSPGKFDAVLLMDGSEISRTPLTVVNTSSDLKQ